MTVTCTWAYGLKVVIQAHNMVYISNMLRPVHTIYMYMHLSFGGHVHAQYTCTYKGDDGLGVGIGDLTLHSDSLGFESVLQSLLGDAG